MKVTGKCGSVRFRLVPAPRGTGLVAAKAPKKLLQAGGFQDVFTSAKGKTKTLGNFVRAAYNALARTNGFLTPDQWTATKFTQSPYQLHTDFLKDGGKDKNAKPYKKHEQ